MERAGGIGAIILLIMLIGGRIIPSFSHNWLARRGPGRYLVPRHAQFDLDQAGCACRSPDPR
jgi:uncharacterized protein involved in response to NO